MSSDSDSENEKNQKQNTKKSPPKNNFSINNSFSQNSPQKQSIIKDQTNLYQQNRKLRRKLKELSSRLDQQLERAAENKLKMQHLAKMNHPAKPESQSLQLQNAYKMIERLQKTVKDFQNKQSYQVSLKRILDLQSIIKKKQQQIQDLKVQVKTQKKIIRDKQKHIAELIEMAKKQSNPTQDKEVINRLKLKMKKLVEDNQQLRKKELNKHQQLVTAERKLVQIQQEDQMPIGREQSLLEQLESYKKKYKEAMQRVEKQNIYITRLNQKLSISKDYAYSAKNRKTQGNRSSSISKSVEELPSLNPKKIKPSLQFMQHLPSPKASLRLKRY